MVGKTVPSEGGSCPIDHTAAINLMTANGEFAGTVDHHESDRVALEKFQRLIR